MVPEHLLVKLWRLESKRSDCDVVVHCMCVQMLCVCVFVGIYIFVPIIMCGSIILTVNNACMHVFLLHNTGPE